MSVACALAQTLSAQTLNLSVGLGKSVFFESEPVYVLIQLRNDGTDTAWTADFELETGSIQLVLRGPDGSTVSRNGLVAEAWRQPGWRGQPVAPGQSVYETAVLQSQWGLEPPAKSKLYRRVLQPGTYSIIASFDVHAGVSDLPQRVESSPVRFTVRERNAMEEALVREVENVRQMAWNPTQRSGYLHYLIRWIEGRVAQDTEDPFLAFLLNQGVQTALAVGNQVSPEDIRTLKDLRVRVVKEQRAHPSAAIILERISEDNPEDLPVLSSELSPSLAADVARVRWAARRRLER